MISAIRERLGRDNRRYRDRMRLRMAVGTGSFDGDLVVELHRLVGSVVLRATRTRTWRWWWATRCTTT